MKLGEAAERLTARSWSPEVVDELIGPVRRACLAHAVDDEVRGCAASGGAVTATLEALLVDGAIDGALVCRTDVSGGRVRARYEVATTVAGLRAAQGSTYVLGEFMSEALPLIERFEGRLAVVALPCEITAIARRPELEATVALRIALFCGHATEPRLVDALVERLAGECAGDTLTEFRFRSGHWRGAMTAGFANGACAHVPFSRYGTHQNLYRAAAKKCLFCGDHFGYDADLSAGDCWSYKMKKDPIKKTALVAKTAEGVRAIECAADAGACSVTDVPVADLLDGQRRVAPFHYNVTARSKAGESLGLKIPVRAGVKARWHEVAAARIVLRQYLATRDREGVDRVLGMPALWNRALLYALKGLESLS